MASPGPESHLPPPGWDRDPGAAACPPLPPPPALGASQELRDMHLNWPRLVGPSQTPPGAPLAVCEDTQVFISVSRQEKGLRAELHPLQLLPVPQSEGLGPGPMEAGG